MELIDTHCHIQSAGQEIGERQTHDLWRKAPDLNRKSMIDEAGKSGVAKMVAVGCTLEDSRLAIDCAAEFPGSVYASIGIHPHEAKLHLAGNEKQQFAGLLESTPGASRCIVAVGECGLDYFYEHSPRQDQFEVLEQQIGLALKHDLPLIFHVREAFDDFWPIFNNFKRIRGVLHSYTDNLKNLDKALAKGLHIGVNGIATFAKGDDRLAVNQAIPLDNLLLETDAPFLTPVPLRGTINSPRNVRLVAEFLAKIRDEDLAEISAKTTANARNLFGI